MILRSLIILCLSLLLAGCDKLGDDYDHDRAAKFWANHSRLSDPSTKTDAAKLSVADQYAIYRYGAEYYRPGRFLDAPLVASGSKAIPLLQSKLQKMNDSWSIWTVAIVLKNMDGNTYDVSADAELSDTLWTAANRADGPYVSSIRQIAEEIAPRHQVSLRPTGHAYVHGIGWGSKSTALQEGVSTASRRYGLSVPTP